MKQSLSRFLVFIVIFQNGINALIVSENSGSLEDKNLFSFRPRSNAVRQTKELVSNRFVISLKMALNQ